MKPAVLEQSRAAWIEHAARYLVSTARTRGEVTAEDLRREFDLPDHGNWTGSAFKVAKADGLVRTGYRPSKDKTRAGGVIGVWSVNAT